MVKGRFALIVAVVLSLLAIVLVYQTIQYNKAQILEKWSLVPVLLAKNDIEVGTELDYDMVAKDEMPKQFVTPSSVEPEMVEKVIGQKARAPLKKGDLILWSHFQSSEESIERLSKVVRKRGRAITLELAGAASVGGWVRPNDHVDVLGSFQDPKSSQMVTVTLLQNVIVLATGTITGNTPFQILEKGERNYSNVTLLVLPEEAEIVALASQLGTLRLTLRNSEDLGDQDDRGRATVETLFTGERVKALQKVREQIQIQVERLDRPR